MIHNSLGLEFLLLVVGWISLFMLPHDFFFGQIVWSPPLAHFWAKELFVLCRNDRRDTWSPRNWWCRCQNGQHGSRTRTWNYNSSSGNVHKLGMQGVAASLQHHRYARQVVRILSCCVVGAICRWWGHSLYGSDLHKKFGCENEAHNFVMVDFK